MLCSTPVQLVQRLPGITRWRWVPFFLAATTALLTVAPSLWTWLWPLAWIALVPLFVALRTASPGQAFLLGWWAEALIYWGGLYWLIGTMVRFGLLTVPVSVLVFALIGLGNGVRLGLFAWWVRRCDTPESPWWRRLLLPACAYVTLDALFPRVFPWYLGVLQFPALPFIQLADLAGVHGVTFVLVVCSVVGAAYVPHPPPLGGVDGARRVMSLAVVLLLLIQGGYGFWRLRQVTAAMQQAPALRLALIQANIAMYAKRYGVESEGQLAAHMALSAATLDQHPDLIIWPESMYPFAVPQQSTQLPWPDRPENQDTHWLIGALTYAEQGAGHQVFNSALLLTPDGRIRGRYDKQQLLAFGEYIPLQYFLPFLRHLSPAIGNITPGTGGLLTLPNGVNVGALICYEDILPALGRHAVRQGAQVLVNLTNDVWFGQTHAPYQHRALAAFRAVENRVSLVRVTNTGLTSVIDALGREHASLPLFQADALVHTIQVPRVPSLYTRYGDWFAQLCSAITLGWSLWSWRRPGGNVRKE